MKNNGPESSLEDNSTISYNHGITVTQRYREIIQEFEDTNSMVEHIRKTPAIWTPKNQKGITELVCSTYKDAIEYGTSTWEETVRLADNGWMEGRKLLVDAQSHHIAEGKVQARSLAYDVAGGFPDIARFIAGDPENMIDLGDSISKQKPVLRITVSPMCPISVGPEARANWGAALLSWISAEELSGHAVELDVIYVSTTEIFVIGENIFGPPVVVKFKMQETNVYKSIDQMAFWLMHNAAHRRVQFALRERLDIGRWYSVGNVYGKAVTDKDEIRKYCDRDRILLVLGEGTKSVDEGLKQIEREVNDWRKLRGL